MQECVEWYARVLIRCALSRYKVGSCRGRGGLNRSYLPAAPGEEGTQCILGLL